MASPHSTCPLVVCAGNLWENGAGNAPLLRDAIANLAQTPHADLALMGHAARARVLDRHDVDVEAAKLAGLIRGSA